MSRTPHPYAFFDSLTPGHESSVSFAEEFRHNRTKAAVDNTMVSNPSDHQSGVRWPPCRRNFRAQAILSSAGERAITIWLEILTSATFSGPSLRDLRSCSVAMLKWRRASKLVIHATGS